MVDYLLKSELPPHKDILHYVWLKLVGLAFGSGELKTNVIKTPLGTSHYLAGEGAGKF